jgi:hypothetical protein
MESYKKIQHNKVNKQVVFPIFLLVILNILCCDLFFGFFFVVFVLGTSSCPHLLDPAILRPGRLEEHIFVPPPNFEARIEIWNCVLKSMPIDVSRTELCTELASQTDGYSGADILNIAREAAMLSLRDSFEATSIDRKYFHNALLHSTPSLKNIQIHHPNEAANVNSTSSTLRTNANTPARERLADNLSMDEQIRLQQWFNTAPTSTSTSTSKQNIESDAVNPLLPIEPISSIVSAATNMSISHSNASPFVFDMNPTGTLFALSPDSSVNTNK